MKLILMDQRDYFNVKWDPDQVIVYNFCSSIYDTATESLKNLNPLYKCSYDNINIMDEKTFDIYYAQYILVDEGAFLDLMKVVLGIYQGMNVVLLVSGYEEGLSRNLMYESICESLMKFLQQRYGIIATYCQSIDNLEEAVDCTFNVQGLCNLDADRMRYLSILQRMRII